MIDFITTTSAQQSVTQSLPSVVATKDALAIRADVMIKDLGDFEAVTSTLNALTEQSYKQKTERIEFGVYNAVFNVNRTIMILSDSIVQLNSYFPLKQQQDQDVSVISKFEEIFYLFDQIATLTDSLMTEVFEAALPILVEMGENSRIYTAKNFKPIDNALQAIEPQTNLYEFIKKIPLNFPGNKPIYLLPNVSDQVDVAMAKLSRFKNELEPLQNMVSQKYNEIQIAIDLVQVQS